MMGNAKERLIQELIDEGYLKTPRIIEAFRVVDRADFVLPEYKDEAYGNYPLPIGEGQTISQPLTVAFLLELLDPRPGEKILDVGAGSGWTTALLTSVVYSGGFYAARPRKNLTRPGRVNPQIIGIERSPKLCEFGKKNLAKYFDESLAKIICADGTLGFPDEAPYDKILAGAAASRDIPQAWRDQLKVGGRIVAPVRGSVWVFDKRQTTNDKRQMIEWEEKEYPGFAFVPLVRGGSGKSQSYGESYAAGPRKILTRSGRVRTIGYWLLAIGLAGGLFANEIYRPHASFAGSKSVEIQQGLGSRKIAEILKETGVIRSKWAFVTYVGLKGAALKLKPGAYVFSHSDSISSITNALARGGTNERVIIIPEGWMLRDIAEYLEREGIIYTEEFLALTQTEFGSDDPNSVWVRNPPDFLKDKSVNAGLEGYLFPDTYRIFVDSRPEDIILKMLENFDRKITPEIRQEIERQDKTLHEIIIMASLIEKEVPHEEDRAIVSGILWKRLKIGMALQVDATITYIKSQNTMHVARSTKISTEDTKIDSPYNTYKYPGLPPGPIANPGLSAIKAAIYPKESPYLYYLSKPDGETVFSRTLEEHNAAKARYLR